MKRRTLYTIGILAAAMAIAAVPDFALARGGGGGGNGGGGGGNCVGSAQGAAMGKAQSQNAVKQQNQYKHQNQYRTLQGSGSAMTPSKNAATPGSLARDRDRTRLQDPSTHLSSEDSPVPNE